MPQRRASSSTVGGVVLAATAFSSTMARSTAWIRGTPSVAVPGASAVLATGRDIRCSIVTIGSAAGRTPAAFVGGYGARTHELRTALGSELGNLHTPGRRGGTADRCPAHRGDR